MGNTYSLWLKYTLLAHIIASFLLGCLTLIRVGFNPISNYVNPVIAATLFTFMFGSLFAYRQVVWDEIQSYVKFVMIWSGLESIGVLLDYRIVYHEVGVIYLFYFIATFIMFGIGVYFETYELSVRKRA